MSAPHAPGPVCPACEVKLTQAHPILVTWFRRVKSKYPTAHVDWSYRDEAAQNAFRADGKSDLPWPNSAHNVLPSLALDLFQLEPDGQAVWLPLWFAAIAADTNLWGTLLRWGGAWVGLQDDSHWELASFVAPKS